LAADLANIEAKIRLSLVAFDPSEAIEAATNLRNFLALSGFGTGGLLEEAAVTARNKENFRGLANCIKSLGDIALRRSDHDAARARFEEALPLYRRIGDLLGEANCIRSLGDIALRRSDHDAARSQYEEALPLYRRIGALLGEANCIRSLADIALRRSDHDAARARYEEALPLYCRDGNVLGEANCIQGLGDIALVRSDHDAARAQFETALKLYERIRGHYSIGYAHRRLARIAKNDTQRRSHINAARNAWMSIDRPDLVKKLDVEFPLPPPPKRRRKPALAVT
jgi:tetratricopeptide (TPR) repeat protein